MYRFIKRFFDLILSLLLFIAISPFFLVFIVLVRIKHGAPVFFRQNRSTLDGRSFGLYKFRTMTNDCDENGVLLPDDKRVTKFGAWLRNTSLDELPELLNIIKGDISIIGPRPMPVEYTSYFTDKEKHRFYVRGGLIPPESLKGNPTPSWDEQLQWEAEYGEQVSFKLDTKIFFNVFYLLFKRDSGNYGIYVRDTLINERKSK